MLKFNLGNIGRRASRTGETIERAGRQVGQVRQVGELFGYSSVIVRLSFAHCSLIVYSSYIVLFVFFNFYIF